MGRFEGKYTRTRGLKRTYDYDLSVLKTADGFSWEAKVSYAGAHFPSDVAAGVLLGCGLTLASYAGYLGWSPPTPTTRCATPTSPSRRRGW